MTNFKKDTKYHEELRNMILSVYDEDKYPLLEEGIEILERCVDPSTGYSGFVLKKGDDIIIVSKGTDIPEEWGNFRKTGELTTFKDMSNNISMGKGDIPPQASNVAKLYDKYKDKGHIILTGDSLGASVSLINGAQKDVDTVAFNPYGVGNLLKNSDLPYSDDKLVTYSNKHDGITTMNSQNHIGKVFEMESNGHGLGLYDHFLHNQKPITEQRPITFEELKVKEGVEAVKDAVVDSAKTVGRNIGDSVYNHMINEAQMYQNLAGNLGEVGRNVGNSVYNHMTNEAQMNQNLAGNLGELGQKIGTNMKNAIGNLGSGIVSTPDKLKSSVSNLNSKVGNVPSNMKKGVNNVVSTATNTPNKVKNAFGNIAPTLTTAQTNMKNAFGNFTSTANAASNNIKNNLDSVGESFKNAIKKVGDLAYKNQATNTSPETQTPNLSQNSTAFGASNLANLVQQKQGQNNKNGLAATNTAFPPVNQPLSSGQGVKNSGFSNNLMQNSLSSSPIAEDPIKKYNLENKNVDGFRLDNGGEIFVKKFSPIGGPPIGGSWQPWSGDFDPSKKLTDMDKDELEKALEFYLKFRR